MEGFALGFAQGLGNEATQRLLSLARRIRVTTGEVLFREGDRSVDVLHLEQGRVALSVSAPGKGEIALLTLEAGEILGWSALVGGTRVSTAVASSDVTAVAFDGEALRSLCEEDHEIGYVVMRDAFEQLARRLFDTRLQLLDLYGREESRT